MQWIITKDLINVQPDDESKVNKLCACKDFRQALRETCEVTRPPMIEQFKAKMNFEFQLFDDDGNLYYEGLCLDLDEQSEESAFGLLDWAEADVGCTYMMYRKLGETKWQQL